MHTHARLFGLLTIALLVTAGYQAAPAGAARLIRTRRSFMSGTRSLESLSAREAVQLLSTAVVGRVAFTVVGQPAIVPVTFAVLDDAVVMRTAGGTRLAAAAEGGVLAFEVDEVDPITRTGWSVVVVGTAGVVVDRLRQAQIHSVVEPFAPGTSEVHIRLPMTQVTGRRVVAAHVPGGDRA